MSDHYLKQWLQSFRIYGCVSRLTLQWRHNGCDSISNHQPNDCLLTVYLGADQRKYQSSASLAFVRGIHQWLVNSPHKWPVTQIMFPFDDIIMNVLNQPVQAQWCTYVSITPAFIGLDKGLLTVWLWAIIWSNTGIAVTWAIGNIFHTKFRENKRFYFKNIHSTMLSANCHHVALGSMGYVPITNWLCTNRIWWQYRSTLVE